MTNSRFTLCATMLAAAAALSSGAAVAQTLAQRQIITHEDASLADEAGTASRICGTTIAPAVDWPSFIAAGKVNDSERIEPSTLCSVPMHTLQSMCQDSQAKQAVMAKIKSYQCVYRPGPAPSLSLDPAGKLIYQSSFEAFQNPSSGTPGDFVSDWLGKHL